MLPSVPEGNAHTLRANATRHAKVRSIHVAYGTTAGHGVGAVNAMFLQDSNFITHRHMAE